MPAHMPAHQPDRDRDPDVEPDAADLTDDDVEPMDPDADPEPGAPGLIDLIREHGDVLAAIAAGGALGSLARWAVAEWLDHPPDGFAASTLLVNIVGAFALGVLTVLVAERWSDRRYLRPFWGVGVLGGFTTFSTFALDLRQAAMHAGTPMLVGYLLATLVGGIAAAWAGLALTRRLVRGGAR